MCKFSSLFQNFLLFFFFWKNSFQLLILLAIFLGVRFLHAFQSWVYRIINMFNAFLFSLCIPLLVFEFFPGSKGTKLYPWHWWAAGFPGSLHRPRKPCPGFSSWALSMTMVPMPCVEHFSPVVYLPKPNLKFLLLISRSRAWQVLRSASTHHFAFQFQDHGHMYLIFECGYDFQNALVYVIYYCYVLEQRGLQSIHLQYHWIWWMGTGTGKSSNNGIEPGGEKWAIMYRLEE